MLNIRHLKKVVEENQLSVLAIEKKAGLSRNTLQNILYGKSKIPNLNTIQALSKAINCDINELIDIKQFKKPKNLILWKENLYLKIVKTILENLNFQGIFNHYGIMKELIDDVYMYTIEGQLEETDEKFIHWLVKKKINCI